ncbi:MAG: asparagine synthetase B, partial [Acidobacteriota bacterium]
MCGINGIVHSRKSGRNVDPGLLARMRDVIEYRGPDGAGIYVDGNIGLGHRRLSIVDLSTGDQPMFNEDRSCVIVYNGEAYNHADHRQELIDRG